jgi:putative transposase
MTDYRRYYVEGGSYFFTVNLEDRKRKLLTENIEALREAFNVVKKAHPFRIDAVVILPDHLHTIWTLPTGDDKFGLRWRQIKSRFSRSLDKGERVSPSRLRKQERGIWQRRFWEHALRNEDDFANHIDYIHRNPIKHGYVDKLSDWPYSSFHRYVGLGIYSPNWLGAVDRDLDIE